MTNSRDVSEPRHFEGFENPTTTPVPDVVFDEFLSWLGEAELKALLYIIRRTFGFKKNQDPISFNQFLRGITTLDGRVLDRGCGVRSRTTLSGALKTLEAKGIIQSAKGIDERGENQTTIYSLRFRGQRDSAQDNTNRGEPNLRRGVVRNSYHPSTAAALPVVRNSYPQQTEVQQTVQQQTARQQTVANGDEKSVFHALANLKQPPEKTEYVAQYIVAQLGDQHSLKFYQLIAAKVPENVIRQTLAEIKTDGARYPERVFTHRMKLYALQRQKQQLFKTF